MVKIRLRRMGNKGRPFYRIVVAKSTAGRDGAFVEVIGHYNPLTKPKQVKIDPDRALYWLLQGAQPTETTAYLLQQQGILERFFEQRPHARRNYKFLDRRTSVLSAPSVVGPVDGADAAPVASAEPAPEAAPSEPPAASEESAAEPSA